MNLDNALAYMKQRLPLAIDGPTMDLDYEDSPVVREFNGDMLVTYVVDQGSHLDYVHNHHLRDAGVEPSRLHDIALENLGRFADEKLQVREYGPVFALFLDGNFEASLLLLDDLWDSTLTQYVGQDVVVAVPSRDVVAAGSAQSSDAIAELHAVVSRVFKPGEQYMLTDRLLNRADGAWTIHDA